MKLHEKYLNSSEGKEYIATSHLYMAISTLVAFKAKAFLESLSESDFKFLKSLYILQFLMFIFLLGKKMLEEKGIRV